MEFQIWTGALLKRLILAVIMVPLPGSLNRFFCTITLKESNVTGITSYVPVIEPEWMSKVRTFRLARYQMPNAKCSMLV